MLRAQKDTFEVSTCASKTANHTTGYLLEGRWFLFQLLNPSQNIHLNSFIRLFVPECRDIHCNGTKLCTPKYSRKKKKPCLTAKLKQFRGYLSTEQTKIMWALKLKCRF